MRHILRLFGALLLCLALIACALQITQSGTEPIPPRPDGALRIATHNVHYIWLRRDEGAWSVGDWERRKSALDAAFKALDADIVAFQEMESFSGSNSDDVNLARSHLLEQNPGYAAAATGPWREFPSTQPILYRRDRLKLVDQGWFFFSDTPDRIYSRTFDGSFPAFASWARFRPSDGGPAFRFVNVHFEYKSRSNRQRSAALVRDRIRPWVRAGEPVILAGDTNAMAGARTMEILEEAGLTFAKVDGATYHFDRGINLFPAIDHLGATRGVTFETAPIVVRRQFANDWPSDHYPVVADIRLPRPE